MSGCGYDDGGTLTAPSLDLPNCHTQGVVAHLEPFVFPVHFMSVHVAAAAVTVRLGPSVAEAWRADMLVFTVPSHVGAAPGLPFRIQLDAAAIGSPEFGRLSLGFAKTCANPSAALVGHGYIEIEHWGTQNGGRIAGRIVADLVDPRDGSVRASGFGGDFDMVVKDGTPYTAFAPRHF